MGNGRGRRRSGGSLDGCEGGACRGRRIVRVRTGQARGALGDPLTVALVTDPGRVPRTPPAAVRPYAARALAARRPAASTTRKAGRPRQRPAALPRRSARARAERSANGDLPSRLACNSETTDFLLLGGAHGAAKKGHPPASLVPPLTSCVLRFRPWSKPQCHSPDTLMCRFHNSDPEHNGLFRTSALVQVTARCVRREHFARARRGVQQPTTVRVRLGGPLRVWIRSRGVRIGPHSVPDWPVLS